MVSMALQGILRDGIATWMPSYISEVFRVDSTVSILTGVALPVFSMFTMWLAAFLYRKLVKSESICSVLFFARWRSEFSASSVRKVRFCLFPC